MHRLSKKPLAALAVAASAGIVGLGVSGVAASTAPVEPPADTSQGIPTAPETPPADTSTDPIDPTEPMEPPADPSPGTPTTVVETVPVPPPSVESTSGTITVSGTGSVTVDPDTAVVNLGVQVNAATGEDAMAQVSTGVADLTDALVAAGIAEEDIQTSGLHLWPTVGDDGATVTGYQASINVDVTIRDITAVGSTIDTAQDAAGPGFTVGGVSFSFADPETVLGDARVEAFQNAQQIAEQYAQAAGVTLGPVETIVDTPLGVPVNFGRVGAMEDAASVAISPGTLDLEVQVTVSFAIS